MKKLIILSAIAFSGLIYNTADAQIGIQVGFHFGTPRVYTSAPVIVEQAPVYDSGNDYYYLPDVNAYYNVNEQCYYYFDGDRWISAAYLPGEYHNFDWRNANRFEVRANRPYMHNEFYRSRYNGHVIGDWDRGYDSHLRGGYGERDRGYHNDGDRFNNRERNGFEQHRDEQHFDNRGGYNQQPQYREQRGGGEQHFDNHNQGGGFNQQQPQYQNREQHNGG